jgi:hypothetical protein
LQYILFHSLSLLHLSSLSGLDKGSKIFSTAVRALTKKANIYLHHSLGSNEYPDIPDTEETSIGSGKDPIKGSYLGRNSPEVSSVSIDEPEEEPESEAEFKFKSIKKSKAAAEEQEPASAGKKGKAANSGDDDDAKEDDDDKIEEPGMKKPDGVEEMKKPLGKSVKILHNSSDILSCACVCLPQYMELIGVK